MAPKKTSICQTVDDFMDSLVGRQIRLPKWKKPRKVVAVEGSMDALENGFFYYLTFEDGGKKLIGDFTNMEIY